MKNNIISVLVPVYNHQKYVEYCLESVKNQKNCNIELLICDDCSSDMSYEIVKNWVNKNSISFQKVKLIRNEVNLGVAKTCNKMINMSSGKFVKIIASDDMLVPDSLEKYIMFMEIHKEFDFVFSNGSHVVETAEYPLLKNQIKKNLYITNPLKGKKSLFDELYKNDFIAAPTVLYRKSTFDKYGLFSEKYVFEDYEYYLRIVLKGAIGYFDCKTVFYRDSDNSLSRFQNNDIGRTKFREFVNDQKDLLEDYKTYTCETMDNFWDNSLGYAMQIHDDEFISYVLNKKQVKIPFKRQLLIFAYKLRFYDYIKKVFDKFNFK